MVEVHSKIRTKVKSVISRLAHDSGIRGYWIKLEKRLNEKQLYRYQDREDVAVIRLQDLRFLSILYVLGVMLGASGVFFILEISVICYKILKRILARIFNRLKLKYTSSKNCFKCLKRNMKTHTKVRFINIKTIEAQNNF